MYLIAPERISAHMQRSVHPMVIGVEMIKMMKTSDSSPGESGSDGGEVWKTEG